jgi:hypothetical protein
MVLLRESGMTQPGLQTFAEAGSFEMPCHPSGSEVPDAELLAALTEEQRDDFARDRNHRSPPSKNPTWVAKVSLRYLVLVTACSSRAASIPGRALMA